MTTRTRMRRWRPSAAFVWLLLPSVVQGYSLPYTAQHPQMCQNVDTEYHDETVNKCCQLCPPGYRVIQSCSENFNTRCEVCAEETFTSTWSVARRCFSCSPKCKAGLVQVRECMRYQDRRCWCPSHEFCHKLLGDTCIRCKPYQQCRKGYGVSTPGTGDRNVECTPCGPGTFSDVESHHATCRPHTICTSGFIPGNSTHDAVCQDVNVPLKVTATSPRMTVTENILWSPHPLGRTSPASNTKAIEQTLSTNPSDVAGILAGLMFAILGLIGGMLICISLKRRAQNPTQPFGKEKQPLSSPVEAPAKWPQASRAVGQEEQRLLQISSSSSNSLDDHPELEKNNGLGRTCMLRMEAGRASSKHPGSGGTHVNVSCTVNVCKPNCSWQLQPLRGSAVPDSGYPALREDDEVPLSKEESPLKHGDMERQLAVEVEDSKDTFAHVEGKPLPVSIQDAVMKMR